MKKISFTYIILAMFISNAISGETIYNDIPEYQVNFVKNKRVSSGGIQVLYRDNSTYHLGDEEFRSRRWARLHGQCYFIKFRDDSSGGNYYLVLDRFGTEAAGVYLNRRAIGYLPDQYSRRGGRPNYWTGEEWIKIPSRFIYEGKNSLAICASRVPNPEFRGDLDDFQIRNIKLIKEH